MNIKSLFIFDIKRHFSLIQLKVKPLIVRRGLTKSVSRLTCISYFCVEILDFGDKRKERP